MKGKLHRINNEWIIREHKTIKNCFGCKSYETFTDFPIHPDYTYLTDGSFDEYKEGKEIEFEIIKVLSDDHDMIKDNLISKKYVKPILNDEWNEIYGEYSTEQYPPFGGPFTHSLTFIEWLKLNYNPPIRKNNQ
jgi:hypothetical protein